MQMCKATLFGAVVMSALVMVSATFDPLTLTVGGTAYVLTGTQVAVAAASLAGLAIAKEALIISALSRRASRGRRDVDNIVDQTPLEFKPFFDAIAASDIADCGKLLVCTSLAKNENALTAEEKLIKKLFPDVNNIEYNTAYGEYQLAAYAGSFKNQEICVGRYARCPVPSVALSDLIKVQEPSQGF